MRSLADLFANGDKLATSARTWYSLDNGARKVSRTTRTQYDNRTTFNRGELKKYQNECDRPFYCDADAENTGFRHIGDAHEIVRLDYTGWYCDEYQDSLAIGFVLQFPARNGKPRYFPAVRFTGSDGTTLYPLDTYDTAEDAARVADQHAESIAEREREYNEKFSAQCEIEDLTHDKKLIREEHSAIAVELSTAESLVIRTTVKNRLKQLRRDYRDACERIAKLCDEFNLTAEG